MTTAIRPTTLVRQTPQAIDVPREPINDADKFQETATKLQQVAHVLSPAIQISALAPQHAINLSVVRIDPTLTDESNGIGHQVYRDKNRMKPDERALNKIGIVQIMQAAGISPVPEHCRRTDDGRERFYWSYYWVGKYLAYDGTVQFIDAIAEVDLRDGSAQVAGWTEKRTTEARRHGLELCETFAMERAIRKMGLKHVYTVAELQKPFVVPRVAIQLDMKDPMTRQMVASKALGGVATLYPGAPSLPAHDAETIDVEPTRRETASRLPELGAAASPTAAGSDVEDLPPATTSEPVIVHRVTSVKRQMQPDTRALFFIFTDRTGDDLAQAFRTYDEGVKAAAAKAKASGALVEIDADATRTIIELRSSGADDAAAETIALPDNARFVAGIESKNGTGKRVPWTRFTIIATTGETFTTFSQSFRDLADEAKRTGMPVLVTLEDNEQYPDTLKTLSIFDTRQRALPLDAGAKL